MKSNLTKRKASSDESELSTCPKTRRLASPENSNSGDSTCESVCCSSSNNNGSSSLKAADLKEEEENKVNVELMATSAGDSVDFRDRSETTPPRADEIGELESTAVPPRRRFNNPRRQSAASRARMPSESEIEDFFSNAEKELQKQFIDRYNFDIAKDEPLEGRYEWVEIQVKP